MFKALSLALFSLGVALSWSAAQAQAPVCASLFLFEGKPLVAKPEPEPLSTEEALLTRLEPLVEAMEKAQLFEKGARKRKKELEHLRKDLEGIKESLKEAAAEKKYVREMLGEWLQFNDFWAKKLQEFEQLPEKEQRELREFMNAPMALASKHLVAFAEAKTHASWKLNQLRHLLQSHKKHPDVNVRASLFIFKREVIRFNSLWEFIRCKY